MFETAVVSMRVDHALKSWVGAERIKHWIEPEQRRSNWSICGERASIGFIKDGLQRSDRPIALSGQRRDAGQDLDEGKLRRDGSEKLLASARRILVERARRNRMPVQTLEEEALSVVLL